VRRYWDYETAEQTDMTAEQVEALLKLELMEAGVVALEPPVPEDVPEVDLPTVRVFSIEHGGQYGRTKLDLAFVDETQAAAFVELAPMLIDADYSMGSDKHFPTPMTELAIVPRDLFDRHAIQTARATLEKAKAIKDRNSTAQAEYTKAQEAVTKATSGVWEHWGELQDQKATHWRIIATFGEYTKTCEGNAEIAGQFLAKAYDAEDICAAFEWGGMVLPASLVADPEPVPSP